MQVTFKSRNARLSSIKHKHHKMWNGFKCEQKLLRCTSTHQCHNSKHQEASQSTGSLNADTIAQRRRRDGPTVWVNPSTRTNSWWRLGLQQFSWTSDYALCQFPTSHVKHRLPLARWRLTVKPNVSPLETPSVHTFRLCFFYLPSCENTYKMTEY